jgi:tRNA_anti-like
MNTLRRMSLISVFVFAVMALAGCGQKKTPPAPEPDTTVPINDKVITPPVGTPKDKDGKPKETPITDAGKDAPVLDAVALTRELGKNPAVAERYKGKVVRINGVVAEVEIKPDGKNPTEAKIQVQGAADSPDKISIGASINDKLDVTKFGPGQKVSIQGRYDQLARTVIVISHAKLVTAGPVAFTQVALEAIRREEPKALAELEKHGVAVRKGGFTHPNYRITLLGTDLTPEGLIKPAVLMPLSRLVGLNEIGTFEIGITDAGLMGLAKLINLRELNLVAEKKIGTRGLAALTKVRGLESLSLAHTPVTDAGLLPLRDMAGLTNLSLLNSAITDAGLVRSSVVIFEVNPRIGKGIC